MEQPRPLLQSERNFERAYIRFLNKSGRSVDIIWVNFTDSYKNHPWLALSAFTKDRLLIDKEFVYFPKPVASRRSLAIISLPLYSLKYRALLEVRNLLKRTEEVDNLDLPSKLSDELKKAITLRNNCVIESH